MAIHLRLLKDPTATDHARLWEAPADHLADSADLADLAGPAAPTDLGPTRTLAATNLTCSLIKC